MFDALTSELKAYVPKSCLVSPNSLAVLKKCIIPTHRYFLYSSALTVFSFSAYNAYWLAVTRHTAFIVLILISDWTIRIHTNKFLVSII